MNNDVIAWDFSTKDSITEWILECHANADVERITLRMPSQTITYEKARPQGECVTCKYRGCDINEKPCRVCSRAYSDLYEKGGAE